MEAIVTMIEKIRTALPKSGKSGYSEATTVAHLIAPMLRVLGWDGFEAIEYEYRVKGGGMVDMALLLDGHPKVFVEAKAYTGAGSSTLSDKDAVQALSYGATAGVEWCVLTNGVHYELYHTTLPLALHDKRVFRADLVNDNPAEVARRLNLLSLASCQDGTLANEGPRVLVETKLREWLKSPDEKLIQFVKGRFGNANIPETAVRDALRSLVAAPGKRLGPVPTVPVASGNQVLPVAQSDFRRGATAISRPIKIGSGYISPTRLKEGSGEAVHDAYVAEAVFPAVLSACFALSAEGVELTSERVRSATSWDVTISPNRRYWSTVHTLGILWAIGVLDYLGSKNPQRFQLKPGLSQEKVMALLQAVVAEDAGK